MLTYIDIAFDNLISSIYPSELISDISLVGNAVSADILAPKTQLS
jgi:hypothetical protein